MAGESFEEGRAHGGELTGRRLDLNFMSDRAAARDVISANLPTVIVPIQSPVVDLMIWIFPFFPDIHCEGKSPDGHILYFVTVGS